MPNKEMPKEVSIMGGCPVPNLCSPLLILAEEEAAGKAKKARLRAQQRGRVAKGKKGRRMSTVRDMWGKILNSWVCSNWEDLCSHALRPHSRRKVRRTALSRQRPERKGESSDSLRPVPPQEEKG